MNSRWMSFIRCTGWTGSYLGAELPLEPIEEADGNLTFPLAYLKREMFKA